MPVTDIGTSPQRTTTEPVRRPWAWELWLLLGLHGLLWLPLVSRGTDNPHQLAACINDEPVIVQQMLGMMVKPYGNPANYLRAPERLPAYWGNLNYQNMIYYGGG